jgi:hypothetical protein
VPRGDHTRGLGGFGAGFFAAFNRNKRSLAVDLKREDGQAVIHRLVPTADVVLENFGPGTMERLGCGYEQLAGLNPRLVYLALKGYLAGPYEHRPALDEVVQFQTGLAFMTGPPGQRLRAGASVIDIMGAVFGVVAAQAALRKREITGKGQRVSSALFESAAFLFNAKDSLFGFLGNFLVTHCGSLPIFYCFPAWQGLTMGAAPRWHRPRLEPGRDHAGHVRAHQKIPCIFPPNREFGLQRPVRS